MIKLDFCQEVQEFKRFYACAKCHIQDMVIPVLLKTCRHIFCTKCLVISGKQHCPQCDTLYCAMDVDRGNKFVTSILRTIRKIELGCQDNSNGGARFTLEFDSENPNPAVNDLISQLNQLLPQSGKTPSDIIIDDDNDDDVIVLNEDIPVNKQATVSRTSVKRQKLADSSKTRHQKKTFTKYNTKDVTEDAMDGQLSLSDCDEEFQRVRLCKDQLKRNHKGETQLHLACKRRNAEMVKQLIESGMDINCVDWTNFTPLHEAVQAKDEHCARLLLDAGCLVNVPAANYTVPLHQATELEHEGLIDLLMCYGGDCDAADINGSTPKDNYHSSKLIQPAGNEKCKMLVFNCDSSKCGPKRSSQTEVTILRNFNVTDGMEYLLVNGIQEHELYQTAVMAALLKAVPIIKDTDLPPLLRCTNLAFLNLVPPVLQAAFKRSMKNRLHRFPKLFDGMHIHLPPHISSYKIKDVIFTRDQLQGLIEIGGGGILKRAPSESSVDGIQTRPYHTQAVAALKECVHYIIYDDNAPPLLLYKMRDLRHVSAQWLLECIWKFEIVWD